MKLNDDKIDEFLTEKVAKAREAALADVAEPRATSAYYDRTSDQIVVNLKSGVAFSFPPRLVQGLTEASPEDLAQVEVTPSGEGLHWETLDADLSIPALLQGVFGTKAWQIEMARRGGRVTSEAKVSAARTNGKKGGRPRKSV